jgi:hypothetical protein
MNCAELIEHLLQVPPGGSDILERVETIQDAEILGGARHQLT